MNISELQIAKIFDENIYYYRKNKDNYTITDFRADDFGKDFWNKHSHGALITWCYDELSKILLIWKTLTKRKDYY